ncbi:MULTISPECIES: TRAP transporter substrate-binding protein [Nitratireductor]|uniref:TRAP transporter substrate-binding protein n=1 Tax=Nitratireductor TaxID=245876 RepID=UPI000ACF38D1|nr:MULTISPECIES: TRAP transporter substrate-binding protein DctP [Nitratireductor]
MKTLAKLLACTALVSIANMASAETVVRMLKTWDDRYPGSVVICDRYAELLTEASGGEIVVQMSGPETIPPLEQLEPTQNGLFQVLCTYPGFHTGSATLLTGLESIRPDAQAFRESRAMEVVRETYGALGLHAISVPLGHGYWIYLNRDLSGSGDLSGMQIRALPPQHPYISAIGGTPVVLPPAEMFSALERGVVDGALFPAAGATGYGFTEVTDRYFDTRVSSPHVILANQTFWDGLPGDVRKVFIDQAEVLENEMPGTYDRLNEEEHERMAEAGMERLTLSDEVAARLSHAIVEGSWSFAASRDADAAGRLRNIVEGAGLLLE